MFELSTNWRSRLVYKGYFFELIFVLHCFFEVLSFGVLFSILVLLIVDLFVGIDCIRVHWTQWFTCVWLKFFCGQYTKQTYIFAPPTGLRKVMVRVPVGWKCLLMSIDFFIDLKSPYITLKILTLLIFDLCIYLFTGSVFIYTKTCPWLWLQNLCGTYKNRKHGFIPLQACWR